MNMAECITLLANTLGCGDNTLSILFGLIGILAVILIGVFIYLASGKKKTGVNDVSAEMRMIQERASKGEITAEEANREMEKKKATLIRSEKNAN